MQILEWKRSWKGECVIYGDTQFKRVTHGRWNSIVYFAGQSLLLENIFVGQKPVS
jgi:hypothetical protein